MASEHQTGDDPDVPELESIQDIENRERIKRDNRELVEDLLGDLLDTAIRKGMLNQTGRLLQEDAGIREAILVRIRVNEKMVTKEAEAKLELSRTRPREMTTTSLGMMTTTRPSGMTTTTMEIPAGSLPKEMNDWEVDARLDELCEGVNIDTTAHLMDGHEWEERALQDLEGIMETMVAKVDVEMERMLFYINNTSLTGKRIVGATNTVEPHAPERSKTS